MLYRTLNYEKSGNLGTIHIADPATGQVEVGQLADAKKGAVHYRRPAGRPYKFLFYSAFHIPNSYVGPQARPRRWKKKWSPFFTRSEKILLER
jgi:hypothetical protein